MRTIAKLIPFPGLICPPPCLHHYLPTPSHSAQPLPFPTPMWIPLAQWYSNFSVLLPIVAEVCCHMEPDSWCSWWQLAYGLKHSHFATTGKCVVWPEHAFQWCSMLIGLGHVTRSALTFIILKSNFQPMPFCLLSGYRADRTFHWHFLLNVLGKVLNRI